MSKKWGILTFAIAMLLGLAGFSSVSTKHKKIEGEAPWRLPLDLTSKEYQALNIAQPLRSAFNETTSATDQTLQTILVMGARNLKWVDTVNSHRPKDQWILMSTPGTQAAYPMDRPRIYNGDIVVKEYNEKIANMSRQVLAVLQASDALPINPPVSDDEFTKAVRAIDGSYQSASRWLMMKPYLSELAERRTEDIRGYYFLSQMTDLSAKLQGYAELSSDDQKQIKTYLLSMCYDVEGNDSTCASKFQSAVKDLNSFYNQYKDACEEIYQSFYLIPSYGARTDMSFANNNSVDTFTIPFTLPASERVMHFVKDNVEAEWTQAAPATATPWALKLDMVSTQNDSTPHVEFQAGATPHVNAIGGNIITMDQNESLDDYSNNWTIRHEFGHVLGFPDCYLEFYDSTQGVIINYQLDITNLMCSRRGHIQDRHYQELKRVYGRSHLF